MNPVAFEMFSVEIRWYGILICLGVLSALLLANYNCKRKNLNFDLLTDVFLWAFPAAIVGARLYYVAFEFDQYKDNLVDIFKLREGGLAIHGGLIGALIAVIIFAKIRKINLLEYADVAAPAIILAQAIGRWGNFMNGEAHGGVVTSEFIGHFPEFIQKGMNIGGNYYHPTFLYESIWNVIVCGILLFILYKRKESQKGIVICSYLSLYSLGRVFIEGLRTDSLMMGSLRVAQVISLAGIVIGIIGIIIFYRKKQIKVKIEN
ncbi:prolipoprotein diacylglyceryl transferase [Clostridium vincentii]|uniref:Phosphatidylglycerol--prolipoprotein diacylglyceryl transferase n=1 Tax=Clostridium vincentii TaxID=52704 RepID=A0A2T0BA31_9CLOT|nr:prolipoprotein diacylglyceryl transferase [Clostridium vincentii]PRR80761.1 Prolipoprotein diacylglyceryl transferase [Clostridium vincentii]